DRGADEDDAVLEQTRIDVHSALAAIGRLYDIRDQVAGRHYKSIIGAPRKTTGRSLDRHRAATTPFNARQVGTKSSPPTISRSRCPAAWRTRSRRAMFWRRRRCPASSL